MTAVSVQLQPAPAWSQGMPASPGSAMIAMPTPGRAAPDPIIIPMGLTEAAADVPLGVPPAIVQPLHADDGRPAPSPCTQAAFTAELETGVPLGLLLAIGRIESGRPDPLHGHVAPWPWTTNAQGVGRFFDDKAQAVSYLRDQLGHGVQSIDVGCFQVNMMYHPDAFPTLEDAFDPLANARYAASFLLQLKARTGSWDAAVGAYHSATPGEGGWYRDRVLATWSGGEITIPAPQRAAFAARPQLADPHVMLVSSTAFGIKVWTPVPAGGAHAHLVGHAGHLPSG